MAELPMMSTEEMVRLIARWVAEVDGHLDTDDINRFRAFSESPIEPPEEILRRVEDLEHAMDQISPFAYKRKADSPAEPPKVAGCICTEAAANLKCPACFPKRNAVTVEALGTVLWTAIAEGRPWDKELAHEIARVALGLLGQEDLARLKEIEAAAIEWADYSHGHAGHCAAREKLFALVLGQPEGRSGGQ